MYGVEPSFWLHLFLLLIILFVLMALFNAILRR